MYFYIYLNIPFFFFLLFYFCYFLDIIYDNLIFVLTIVIYKNKRNEKYLFLLKHPVIDYPLNKIIEIYNFKIN